MPHPIPKAVVNWWQGLGLGKNLVITLGALVICSLLMPLRLPGMTLMEVSPNWLLIWLICWSVNRPVLLAVLAGISIGLVQDSLTIPAEFIHLSPSHTWGMALTAGITALLQKQRYIKENFISIALIVFGMTVLAETMIAIQLSLLGYDAVEVWAKQQRITLISALLTSLWTPVVYFPLSKWW
jgi:rod shape-determining protein MreD